MANLKFHTLEELRAARAASSRNWRNNHIEKDKATKKKYRLKNRERINSRYRRRHLLKRLGFLKPGMGLEAAEKAFQDSMNAYNKKYG